MAIRGKDASLTGADDMTNNSHVIAYLHLVAARIGSEYHRSLDANGYDYATERLDFLHILALAACYAESGA